MTAFDCVRDELVLATHPRSRKQNPPPCVHFKMGRHFLRGAPADLFRIRSFLVLIKEDEATAVGFHQTRFIWEEQASPVGLGECAPQRRWMREESEAGKGRVSSKRCLLFLISIPFSFLEFNTRNKHGSKMAGFDNSKYFFSRRVTSFSKFSSRLKKKGRGFEEILHFHVL